MGRDPAWARVKTRIEIMRFKPLETVVLNRDLPDRRLQKGDLGAVVQLYEPDGLEVEFVSASGKTEALVTLKAVMSAQLPTET